LNDPLNGHPEPELAIPASIQNVANEPVVLLCHAPDYADRLLTRPEGQAVALMLSGHTHGGQIRVPLLGALVSPQLGKKYIEGWFRLGNMQLHVNRGIGTIGLPFRLDCPPEISLLTLRARA
jgi:predicted MPP superfamily phosphohydrolase